jgi:16S rRNA (uracil1498-N3)-methyltransferase
MAKPADTNHRLFVESPLKAGSSVPLTREQANYLFNVLRLEAGAGLLTFNGRDGEWLARLEGTAKRAPALKIERQTRVQTANGDIDYYFAPLKSARLDYLMQKGVEMGVGRMVPVITRRTQVTRFNAERARANMIEAAEQCEILSLPELGQEIKLERLIADWPQDRILIFCDEAAEITNPILALGKINAGHKLALLIGPEGGFDEEERRLVRALPQAVPLSLGPRILRADTAAVVALTLIQAVLGDLAGVSAN